MTPTEFLQDRNIIAEDKTDLIIGFDNGTKESLIDLLEKYHQHKLKLLGIANVVGQSEQLVCDCENPTGYEDKSVSKCLDCDKEIKQTNCLQRRNMIIDHISFIYKAKLTNL